MADATDMLDRALEEGLLTQSGRYFYHDGETIAGSRQEATEYLLSLADGENLDVPLPKDTPAEDTPSEDAPAGDASAEDTPANDTPDVLPGPFRMAMGGAVDYTRPDGRTGTLYPGMIYRDLPATGEIQRLIDTRQLLPLG